MQARNQSINESELVQSARDGDAWAFEQLVITHQDRVFSTLLRMVGDAAMAADLAQEVFVKAWKTMPEFDDRAKFSTWLHRVAHNEAVSYFRHKTAQKRGGPSRTASLDHENAPSVSEDARRPSAAAVDPAQSVEADERAMQVRAAIDSLDTESRLIVVLREMEGLSYDEIAERLELNVGTVRSRLFRARERLREKLAGVV